MKIMRESLFLDFLYRTVLGRAVLSVVIRPRVSRAAGRVMDSGLSKPLIRYYIRKYDISLDDIDVPEKGFRSFNDFFTRKKKQLPERPGYGDLISPCDGFLSCVDIDKDTVLPVKQTSFTLRELLKDDELAEEFNDGKALIFRLTPANYHRYVYVADGESVDARRIPGVFHCVRPIATERIPVYCQNAREYSIIETEEFGKIVQMEVGAMFVGKINNLEDASAGEVRAMDEKGYFEFGGSTIIILLQKGKVDIVEGVIAEELVNEAGEVAVRLGELIGKTA